MVVNGLCPLGAAWGDAVEARAVLARLRSVLGAQTGLESLSPLLWLASSEYAMAYSPPSLRSWGRRLPRGRRRAPGF
eukprot:2035405-Alexandrium_andersonii.AAC.1